ncbi:MAG: hypothetical protein H6Q37_1626 [Chloroflexi bacterium]|nr:hypothetical protein [Chloroflexota bacterium]
MKRVDLIFRIIFFIVLGGVGIYYGIQLANLINQSGIIPTTIPPLLGGAILGVIGAIVGFLIAPYLTTIPAHWLRVLLTKLSTQTLVAGLIGLVAGLIVAALLAFPLSFLPTPFGDILPFIGVLVFSYVGVMVFVMRQNDIFSSFRARLASHSATPEESDTAKEPQTNRTILCDTSVIIDGRIADVARTGFLMGTLLIPRFVLNELQYIADSPDNLRRQRGRRGMEVLSQLQKETTIPVKISDIDVDGIREVDEKLVVLARQMTAPILTNDYNLNRVAELQGVKVLNVNELSNAVKSVLLPGESLLVNIIQEGRESGQGVAYLDDGTMVVVEDGRERISQQVNVTVTKILQTNAGRMIFARLE